MPLTFRRLSFGTMALGVAFLLAGCSADEEGPAIEGVAHVDVSTNTIAMPIDAYALSREDDAVATTANALAFSRCMGDAGFGEFSPFVDRRNPPVDVNWRYGVWNREEVARYGYTSPPPSKRETTLLGYNSIEFTPEADKAYESCIEVVDDLGLRFAVTQGVDGAAGTEDPMQRDDAREVIDAWGDCLAAAGVERPGADDPWAPPGVDDLPLEQQIKVGLIDVGCKEDLGTVQKLADIEAATQAPYIEANEAALVAQLEDAQRVLKAAREYLATAEADGALK